MGNIFSTNHVCHDTQVPRSGAMKSPDPPFKFLELPGEVCNKIYRLLLVDDQPIYMPVGSEAPPAMDSEGLEVHSTEGPPMKVLRICRQVFEEASPIFYGENVFNFLDTLYSRQTWHCPPRYRQHVRKINMRIYRHWPVNLDIRIPGVLKQFTGLEEVKIQHNKSLSSRDKEIPEVHEDMKQALRIESTDLGSILAALPSADVWLIEKQVAEKYRYVPNPNRSKRTMVDDADDNDKDESNGDTSDTSKALSSEHEFDEEDNLDDTTSDDSSGICDTKEREGYLTYLQRVVIHQATLDHDSEVPFSVMLVPHHVEEWHYARARFLYDGGPHW